MPRAGRVVRKTVVGLGLFALAAAMMWRGAGIVAERMNRVQPSTVSFADAQLAARQLVAAHHTPARGSGSFIMTVSIGAANVEGVRLWLGSQLGTRGNTGTDTGTGTGTDTGTGADVAAVRGG